ncbi:protein kinase [Streptomyces sp. NPDC005486]|uniref:protein kinase domain-containing protein n=1 Tax=Streptomyces sp. NPDC005486 TaxID=3155345 RepID=UPI0033A27B35
MGEVFAGRYELADPIGRGGVGAVWRAWDHRRRRYVAAKVLQQSDAHALLRFVREQALRIDHPHVLAPASWAADDDKVLFTMDLVAGGSLVHLVGDYGPLPPVFVCTLLDQLLSGLTAVHAEGVVHRDIKPANILLEATGTARPRLRLSDFGIAMRLGEPRLTETNLVVGTPGYLAPEQMMGADPDFPADLFAVGLVALYLLEGAKPDAKALVQYFAEHGTPGAPKSVPEPLWQVVATLLQPDPQARFRTATGARKALAAAAELLPEPGPDDELIEIFDQLGPLPAGFGPDGPPKPPRTPGPRPVRRNTAPDSADLGAAYAPDRPDAVPAPGLPNAVPDYGRPNTAPGPADQGTARDPGHPTTAPESGGPGTGSLPARPEAAPDAAPPGTGSFPSGPTAAATPVHPGRVDLPPRPGSAPEPGRPVTGSGNGSDSDSGSVWPGGDSVRPAFGDESRSVRSAPGRAPDHAPRSGPDDAPRNPDSVPTDPRRHTHPAQGPATPASALGSTPLPSMSDTGSFHLPPPQPTAGSYSESDSVSPEPPTPHPPAHAPAPGPLAAPPYEPTFVLPTRGRRGDVSTASYTTQDPHGSQASQAPLAPHTPHTPHAPRGPASARAASPHGGRRGHRAARRERPGPPAKVALPLLFLALACYAVGFWALTRI